MLCFPKTGQFPEVIVSSPGEKATLTSTGLVIGDPEGSHVSIAPSKCTIQSASDSISLTSQSVTTANSLGSVERTWAQIAAVLSAPALPTGGTLGQVLSVGAGNSLTWANTAAQSFVSAATDDLIMGSNDITSLGNILLGGPATQCVVSDDTLRFTKIRGLNTDTLTITGKNLTVTHNNDTKTIEWDEVVNQLISPPTFESLLGTSDKYSLSRNLLGTTVTSNIDLASGSFGFQKETAGLKLSGGISSTGLTYTSEVDEVSTTTLALNLNDSGDVLLKDANRTFLGARERESIVADYVIPEDTNLSFSVYINASKSVSITLPAQPKLGQQFRIFSNESEHSILIPGEPQAVPLRASSVLKLEYTGSTWVGANSSFWSPTVSSVNGASFSTPILNLIPVTATLSNGSHLLTVGSQYYIDCTSAGGLLALMQEKVGTDLNATLVSYKIQITNMSRFDSTQSNVTPYTCTADADPITEPIIDLTMDTSIDMAIRVSAKISCWIHTGELGITYNAYSIFYYDT